MSKASPHDRWIAIEMAGNLVAVLQTQRTPSQRDKIREVIDRLLPAVDDPSWTPPWEEEQRCLCGHLASVHEDDIGRLCTIFMCECPGLSYDGRLNNAGST